MESIFESVNQQLKLVCSKDQLRANIKSISGNVHRLLIPAKDYNFEQVEANGFQSVIKLCLKFCELVLEKVDTIDDHYDDLVASSRYIKGLSELAGDLADQQNINCDSLDLDHSNIFLYSVQNQKDFAVLLTKFPGFWCRPSPSSNVYISMNWALKALAFLRFNSIKMLFNEDYRSSSMVQSLINLNFHALSPVSVICMKMTSFCLRVFAQYSDVSASTVYIPRTSKFEIPENVSKVQYNVNRRLQSHVRCRLVNKYDARQTKPLILHCHGGGFALGCPDFDEVLYLNSWCHRLPNCAILSIEYPLSVPHPRALQTVLDVYIWLQTSEDVQQTLGFKPSKIIFCGDSSGSSLLAQLTMIVNDLTQMRDFTDHMVKLPSAMVLFFGVFYLITQPTPSKLISHVDSFLFSTSLLSMQATYSGLNDNQENPGLIPPLISRLMDLLWPKSESPSYLESEKEFHKFSKKVFENGQHAYACPPKCIGESTLGPDIPLFLISSHCCPLLDDSVQFAKVWRGPVTMKVFDEAPHGAYFLQFGDHFEEVINLLTKALLL